MSPLCLFFSLVCLEVLLLNVSVVVFELLHCSLLEPVSLQPFLRLLMLSVLVVEVELAEFLD